MDRRTFLTAGGLAAASPLLASAAAAGANPEATPDLFKWVNFATEGLGLDPLEYATLMRETAMAAPLDPDFYSNGGLIEELEHTYAKLLGKEAAMFVPTGTLANHIAVRKLAGNDRRVLVPAESHLFNDSGDCAETLSGLNLIPLGTGRATLSLDEVKSWVERSAAGRVEMKVGAISIENPVRRRDHEMVDPAELERVCNYARQQGIRLHLDGARMFNLPYHSGKSLREYAALFDTVFVSLWKHFNGASGAMLAGDAEFIDGLFHTRRMFGGSLPQAWTNVALVPRYVGHYEDDYAKAWQAADRLIALLQADRRFKVQKVPNGTSRFFLTAPGADSKLTERALQKGVILPHAHPVTDTFAMQVNPTIARMSPDALAKVLIEALG